MDQQQFVYVTYIATSPEKLWSALIDPATTEKYWQNHNVSDWRSGSTWEHRGIDAQRTLRMVGKVLESSPPRRLVITWAAPEDAERDQGQSRVAFDIEPTRDLVCLTVTHDHLEPGSEMLRDITDGWPKVLSSLKSLLERGKALPQLW